MNENNSSEQIEIEKMLQKNYEEAEKAIKIIEHSGVFSKEKIDESQQMLAQYKKALHDFVYKKEVSSQERTQIENNLYATVRWMLDLDKEYDRLEAQLHKQLKNTKTFH